MEDDMWAGMDLGQSSTSVWRDDRPKHKPLFVIPDRLPEDIEAEASLISTLCSPGIGLAGVEAAGTLVAEDFVHPYYRHMFVAARALQARDQEINLLTLRHEMERQGTLDKVGGIVTLSETLAKDDMDRPMVLAEILKAKSRLRELIKTGSRIVERAVGLGDHLEILSEASEAITRLVMADPGKQIITDLTDLLDDLAEGKQITTENGGKAMSWGDDTMDRLCPIPRGEPTIVCARPGAGKSALAIQILVATVERNLGKPLFLSLEMGREKVKARIAAHLSDVNSRVFRDGQYDGDTIERILDRKQVLSEMKVMFPHQQCRVEEIESLVKHAVEIHGVTCVVLDQFSHVGSPREAAKDTYAIANAQTSKHITALAKNLNLGWVTLAQINKDGEDSRRPTMKDLAATDRLVQDAAVIFGLWNKGSDEHQEVWGTIMKNRDDGFKGWAKQLSSDYGTCHFRVQESETFSPRTRF